MKTGLMITLVCLLLIGSVAHAKAADILYLPLVLSLSGVGVIAQSETPDYVVDSIRLWHISEKDGMLASPVQCGDPAKLQIHIFDVDGDHGARSRLNGVTVHVVHIGPAGRSEETLTTGLAGMDPGVVEFSLQERAEISIQSTIDGQRMSSEMATVTNIPYEISYVRLIASGYCTDTVSCQTFVAADSCWGNLSWNVVFKRSY